MDSNCLYCEKPVLVEDCLKCLLCKKNVHTKCLKRPGTPGDFMGDIFFDFKCIHCTSDKKEIFVRRKLPWLLIIVLTLYNLSIHSKGLSHYGYFHWRTHISNFITKNWINLFPPNFKPKKQWIGTIAGTLSHNNPEFFVSGFDFVNESGWWKLTYNQTPKFYLSLYESVSQKRSIKIEKTEKQEEINVVDLNGSDSDETVTKRFKTDEEIFSRTLPYMGRPPRIFTAISSSSSQKNYSSEYDTESIQSNLTDFLANELSNSTFLDEITNLNAVDNLNPENDLFLTDNDNNGDWNLSDVNFDLTNAHLLKTENSENTLLDISKKLKINENDFGDYFDNPNNEHDSLDNNDGIFYPRIIQVTNFQEAEENGNDVVHEFQKIIKSEPGINIFYDDDFEIEKHVVEEQEFEKIVCEKSLFRISEKREYPWLQSKEENSYDVNCGSIEMMNVYEESLLHQKLKIIIDGELNNKTKLPSWIHRTYRKISLRVLKRSNLKPIFNLDSVNVKTNNPETISKQNPLDRFYHLISSSDGIQRKEESSFHARLAGSMQYELFVSPYTGRVLHPFIYKNQKCVPPWVKLMCEMQYFVNEQFPERSSVDFCYVQPQHIPAVNGLLQRIFWPGIDMSDSLSYPDFSVIALYKKLVIGCAFLVPDISCNEAYVSFMAVRPGWQRSGIATFMLYHLTQTCMSKDITLHVSATNSAICLYQKFGFKIEEIVLDFYEKYLPLESKESRHALLLRMKR